MVHRTASRTEAELSAAGLHWSEAHQAWQPADSAEAQVEEASALGRAPSRASAAGAAFTASTEKAGLSTDSSAEQAGEGEVVWLEWDGPEDKENPYNWTQSKKWLTTCIVCAYTVCVSFCAGAISAGNTTMTAELNCSHELAVMALAGFPLGFGLGPLVLAPFSETYGRHRVYILSSILFTIFLVPIARAQNVSTVIVFRIFLGIAGSSGSTLVGGTIADMFTDKDRGLALGIFSVCSLSGTGLGPTLMGWVELAWGWRGIEYVQLVFAGVLSVLITACTRETRGSVLLSRRAAKLRKDTGDNKYQCRADAERASMAIMVKTSLTRPLCESPVHRALGRLASDAQAVSSRHLPPARADRAPPLSPDLLFTEPVVAAFSLFIGFGWGIIYLCLEAVPLVMTNVYGFNAGQSGSTFAAIVVAAILGGITNLFQERLYAKNVAKRGPEARLYLCMAGGLLFPSGILIFAFSQGRGHWMGPVFGLGCVSLNLLKLPISSSDWRRFMC